MGRENYIQGIICQVLVQEKSEELIYLVLDEFIPGCEKRNFNHVGKLEDENYEFASEDEMLEYYIGTIGLRQTFYWNKKYDNPLALMVGANITIDDQIVFSLTFNGTDKLEEEYFLRLKKLLNSDIGVISYINPVEYNSGSDFKIRYLN